MVVLVDSHKRKGCLLRFFFTGVTGILQGGHTPCIHIIDKNPPKFWEFHPTVRQQCFVIITKHLKSQQNFEANSYAASMQNYCSGPKNKTGKTLQKAASPERAEYS